MTRRAIVHIGTEKTGTTTLQLFLKRNRKTLRERGFIYPGFCGDVNQTGLAAYAMQDGRQDPIRGAYGVHAAADVPGFRRRMERAAQMELSSDATAIFCNEHCHSRLIFPAEVARLKALLDPHFDDIRIAVYLRRQDQLAASLYTTRIKSGGTESRLMPDTAPDNPYYNYDRMLRLWEDVFGQEAMTVRLFDRSELVGGSIISDFLHVWGIGAEEDFQPVQDQNESLLPEAQEFLRMMNAHFQADAWASKEALLGPLVTMLTRNFAGRGIRPARGAARAFYERYKDGNAAVAKRYFPDRACLFDENFDKYPETADDRSISPEDCARIAARLHESAQRDIQRLEAEIAIRDAMLLWEREAPDAAIARLKRAAARFSSHGPVFRSLGEVLARQQDFPAAAEAAARAAELVPASDEYQHFLGFTLRRAGKPAEAETALRKAVALNPEHEGARTALRDLMQEAAQGSASSSAS